MPPTTVDLPRHQAIRIRHDRSGASMRLVNARTVR